MLNLFNFTTFSITASVTKLQFREIKNMRRPLSSIAMVVLILEGHSEIGVQVRIDLGYLIWLRHLLVTNLIIFS